MGESRYILSAPAGHSRFQQQQSEDSSTPYSAVSSFNLPSFCDSSLVTPVSLTNSPPQATNPAPVLEIEEEKDIKLCPSEMSPTFPFMTNDEDYPNYRQHSPMKYKNPSGALHTSSADSAFPFSPVVCPEPFWGAYGVSATPVSVRSESSANGLPSPAQIQSMDALNNNHPTYPRQQPSPQSSSGYRSPNTSVFMRTNPLFPLRPATTSSQNTPHQSISMAPRSATIARSPFPEPLGSLPPRGKKRKSPGLEQNNAMVLEPATKPEDKVLLDKTHYSKTPWKDVIVIMRDQFGIECTDSCLQMRKKRLVDRLRRWLEEDRRALLRAVDEVGTADWFRVSEEMMRYGCKAKYSRELCQKEWQRLHPDDSWYSEVKSENSRPPEDEDSFSDTSRCHSLQDGDSAAMMPVSSSLGNYRSRATSDASMHYRRHPQHMSMYEHQQQRSGWGPEA